MSNEILCKAPFEYFVLDIKHCGIDQDTGKPALMIIFMDLYTEVVLHSQFTTQTLNNSLLTKFLRVLCNKSNINNIKFEYKLITALYQEEKHLINTFLKKATDVVFDQQLSNKLCDNVRSNFVTIW